MFRMLNFRMLNFDNKLQEAFNVIKEASQNENIKIWVQDRKDKEKYFVINPETSLNYYIISKVR